MERQIKQKIKANHKCAAARVPEQSICAEPGDFLICTEYLPFNIAVFFGYTPPSHFILSHHGCDARFYRLCSKINGLQPFIEYVHIIESAPRSGIAAYIEVHNIVFLHIVRPLKFQREAVTLNSDNTFRDFYMQFFP